MNCAEGTAFPVGEEFIFSLENSSGWDGGGE